MNSIVVKQDIMLITVLFLYNILVTVCDNSPLSKDDFLLNLAFKNDR